MKKWFLSYIDSLQNDVPYTVYEALLSFFCISVIILIAWKGIKAWRHLVGLMLIEYVIILLCITVFFRDTAGQTTYSFELFWTYHEISRGIRNDLLPQVIMNVVVFVPIGVMVGALIYKLTSSKRWIIVIGFGLALSISIEAMQFFFNKGFSELDDVIHNTLGCMIGFGICRGLEKCIKIQASSILS